MFTVVPIALESTVFHCEDGDGSAAMRRRLNLKVHGYTVIELLVVLASVALLLAIAAPRYIQHVERAREVALMENLHRMRDSIDKFYADFGRYPSTMAELVERQYLRTIPVDPVTDRVDTWVGLSGIEGAGRGIRDVKSGAKGLARNGTTYESW